VVVRVCRQRLRIRLELQAVNIAVSVHPDDGFLAEFEGLNSINWAWHSAEALGAIDGGGSADISVGGSSCSRSAPASGEEQRRKAGSDSDCNIVAL
jgi:hypothetical protein